VCVVTARLHTQHTQHSNWLTHTHTHTHGCRNARTRDDCTGGRSRRDQAAAAGDDCWRACSRQGHPVRADCEESVCVCHQHTAGVEALDSSQRGVVGRARLACVSNESHTVCLLPSPLCDTTPHSVRPQYDLVHISVGDLLREEVKNGTAAGGWVCDEQVGL
jgi:hypothetical protein